MLLFTQWSKNEKNSFKMLISAFVVMEKNPCKSSVLTLVFAVYVFNSLGNSEYTLQFNQGLNQENVSSKMRFKNNQNEYRKMFHTALLSYLYVKYF